MFLDVILSKWSNVTTDTLQLIGVACLMNAVKLHDSSEMHIDQLVEFVVDSDATPDHREIQIAAAVRVVSKFLYMLNEASSI